MHGWGGTKTGSSGECVFEAIGDLFERSVKMEASGRLKDYGEASKRWP